jgi:RNA polymerase sigma-70 factor (ECF subfamily)
MADREIIELAERAIRGDSSAFEELCKNKTSSVIYNALAILGNIHDAEDAAQETFMQMFKHIGNLKSADAINLWMLRITQNVCKRMLAKRAKYSDAVDLDDDENDVEIEEDNREFLPEEYAQDSELSSKLYDIVMGLPEKRREVIFLYHYNELSYNEIADIMGISVKTVATNLMRAREMIKEQLGKIGDGKVNLSAQVATGGVLGTVLKNQESLQVPENSVKLVQGRLEASLKAAGANGHGGASSVFTTKAIAIVASSVLALAAVTFVIVFSLNMAAEPVDVVAPPVVAAELPPAEIYTDGDIEFTGGHSSDGHVNPTSVELINTNFEIKSVDWFILDARGTVYEGEGTDPSGALAELLTEEKFGSYTFKYIITDQYNNTIEKSRDFEIE